MSSRDLRFKVPRTLSRAMVSLRSSISRRKVKGKTGKKAFPEVSVADEEMVEPIVECSEPFPDSLEQVLAKQKKGRFVLDTKNGILSEYEIILDSDIDPKEDENLYEVVAKESKFKAIAKKLQVPTAETGAELLKLYNFVQHENLLELTSCYFQTKELWLVFEYMDFGQVSRNLTFKWTEPMIAFLAAQLLPPLIHLHTKHVYGVHINSETVFLAKNGQVKLVFAPDEVSGPSYQDPKSEFLVKKLRKDDAQSAVRTLLQIVASKRMKIIDIGKLELFDDSNFWTKVTAELKNFLVTMFRAKRSLRLVARHPFLLKACPTSQFDGLLKQRKASALM